MIEFAWSGVCTNAWVGTPNEGAAGVYRGSLPLDRGQTAQRDLTGLRERRGGSHTIPSAVFGATLIRILFMLNEVRRIPTLEVRSPLLR